MLSAQITLKAQFYDIDSMEVAWHGNYPRFLEQARCELLDKLGYNYIQMKASGYAWPIVDMRIKYVRPIRFGQEFTVDATVAEYENGLKIDYRLCDRTSGEVLTKARTFQVPVSIETGELCLESPAALTDKLRALA
jgi:acyl-CoA thioester hydrolase